MAAWVSSSGRRIVTAVGYQLNQADCLHSISLVPAGDTGKDRFNTSKQKSNRSSFHLIQLPGESSVGRRCWLLSQAVPQFPVPFCTRWWLCPSAGNKCSWRGGHSSSWMCHTHCSASWPFCNPPSSSASLLHLDLTPDSLDSSRIAALQ